MEFIDYVQVMLSHLLGSLPALLLWIAVIIFGVVRRQGGGRAERFLIAGGIVGAAAALLSGPATLIPFWLRAGHPREAVSLASTMGIVVNVIGVAGIGLLIYAFWLKFHERKTADITILELERGPHDAVPR
jgi:hypothetical protein